MFTIKEKLIQYIDNECYKSTIDKIKSFALDNNIKITTIGYNSKKIRYNGTSYIGLVITIEYMFQIKIRLRNKKLEIWTIRLNEALYTDKFLKSLTNFEKEKVRRVVDFLWSYEKKIWKIVKGDIENI